MGLVCHWHSGVLSPSTDIYIVTYSEVPTIQKDMLSAKAQERYEVQSIKEIKKEFCKYFFDGKDSSSLSIEKLINKTQIAGLIGMKHDYMKFINTDEIEIECQQDIKNTSYRFVFRFIDISNKEVDSIRCI